MYRLNVSEQQAFRSYFVIYICIFISSVDSKHNHEEVKHKTNLNLKYKGWKASWKLMIMGSNVQKVMSCHHLTWLYCLVWFQCSVYEYWTKREVL